MAITFDQPSVRQMMLDKIKDLAGVDYDALQFSTLNLLLEAIAEAVSQLALYDEYLTRESAWDTAENYYSLRAQMKTRGYKPKRMKGATGYLIFSTVEEMVTSPSWAASVKYELDDYVVIFNETSGKVELYQSIHTNGPISQEDPEGALWDNNIGYSPLTPANLGVYWQRVNCQYAYDVDIPLGTAFSGLGLTFVSTLEMKLIKGEEYAVVPIKQGIRKSATLPITGNSVGDPGFPRAEISDRNIDQEFYFLTVDAQQYTELPNIYEALLSTYGFEISPESDVNNLYFILGNGQFGVRPPVGVNANLIYLETEGLSGEVYSLNVIDTVKDTVYYTDDLGLPQSITCFCSNPATITGAYNGDTIAQIKSGAITAYQSRNRAITLTDYQRLLNDHPSVGDCLVWSEYEECLDNDQEWDSWAPDHQNKIHVCGYTQTGMSFPQEVQDELLTYLYYKKSPMDVLVFEPVEVVGMIFIVRAYVSGSTYSLPTIKQNILTLLQNNYSATTLGFKTPVYETAWKGQISQVAGVTYHNSSVKLVKEVALDGEGSSLSVTTQLPFVEIDKDAYELWMQLTADGSWAQIASMATGATQINWVAGYDIGVSVSASQLGDDGKIKIEKIAVPVGADTTQVRIRIVYELEDLATATPILDFIPSRRNQVLNFVEARVLNVEYT